MKEQSSSDLDPNSKTSLIPSLKALAMEPAFKLIFEKYPEDTKITSLTIPIELVREYIAYLRIDISYGYVLDTSYCYDPQLYNMPADNKIEENRLYLYPIKNPDGDILELAFKNQQGEIERQKLLSANQLDEQSSDKSMLSVRQALLKLLQKESIDDQQEQALMEVLSKDLDIYKYHSFESVFNQFTIGELHSLIQVRQRIPLGQRKKMEPWEILCSFGTKESFDRALKEFDLVNKSETQKKRILQYLLLSNNRQLLKDAETALFGHNDHLLDLSKCDFFGWKLRGLNLDEINFSEASFNGADLSETTLFNADVRNAIFFNAQLVRADLRSVKNLKTADWRKSNLCFANLENVDLEEEGGHSSLEKVFPFDLEKFHANEDHVIANFADADLSYANLTGASLAGGNFQGVDFSNAQLERVNFSRCSLKKAKFNDAYSSGAIFGEADLDKAEFRGTDLRYASFADTKRRQFKNEFRNFDTFSFIALTPVGILFYSFIITLIITSAPLWIPLLLLGTISDEIWIEPDLSSRIKKVHFENVQAQGANFKGKTFTDGRFENVNLTDAEMSRVTFKNCETRDANFDRASVSFFPSNRNWIVKNKDGKSQSPTIPTSLQIPQTMFSGNNTQIFIRLLEIYVAGKFLLGSLWRNHVKEVSEVLLKVREQSRSNNLSATELITQLAQKLKKKTVNRKGELYKLMNVFCLLQLNETFEKYLIKAKTGDDIAETANALLSTTSISFSA